MRRSWVCLMVGFLLSATILEARQSKGSIEGIVTDMETKEPVASVDVLMSGSKIKILTDSRGHFIFSDVSAGPYSLSFSAAYYEMLVKTDIIVRPKRITYVDVALKFAPPRVNNEVTVTSQYFAKNVDAPSSAFSISDEEIRRAPGAYGDINRMVKMLPGTLNLSDQYNDLIVRGGSSAESGFVVDNIEIPNLNHFPSLQSSGGMFSALNPDVIQEANFYTGNFPAEYGDRLSSILNIKLREGNRREFDGQIDLNLGQAGAVLEGPLGKDLGSWLLSFRQSYLQVFESLGILEFGEGTPRMRDVQAKIVFQPHPRHKLTFVDFYGGSGYSFENTYDSYDYNNSQNSAGLNWLFQWSDRGYSETTVSYSRMKNQFGYKQNNGRTQIDDENSDLTESALALRSVHYLKLSNAFRLEAGAKLRREEFGTSYSHQDLLHGKEHTPIDETSRYTQTAAFANLVWNPVSRLTLNGGLRYDHSSLSKKSHISPRLSLNYEFSRIVSIHAGFGHFYQAVSTLVPILRWDWGVSYDVPDPWASHFIVGIDVLPRPSMKLTLEAYAKEYREFPTSSEFPEKILTDQRPYEGLLVPNTLLSTGRAYSRGMEFFLQKKLTGKISGIASISYSQSRYQAYSGTWHDRNYDSRWIVNLSMGYRPNAKWEIGGRWTYSSGMPYTPFARDLSILSKRAVYDETQVNGLRLPPYSSLNVRVDRRFNFSGSNLVVYLDLWNVANRKNVYHFYWSNRLKDQQAATGLPILPLLGFVFEF